MLTTHYHWFPHPLPLVTHPLPLRSHFSSKDNRIAFVKDNLKDKKSPRHL